MSHELTSRALIWEWCRMGWRYRKFDKKLSPSERKRYAERVKYELDLMESKDFLDYFLVLSDAVRAVKNKGIPVGPGRGSAAASLVCYLLRITEVDPMIFPLMVFERFIDPNRHDLPDVDLDFDDEMRDEVRQHFIRRYGADRVGNIGTFTRYRGKNAIDDVARVYQIPGWEVDKAKEFLVERSGGDSRFDASISDTVEMFPQVKEVFDKFPDLYRSMELEGNYKSFGVHAAGVVVGADKLWKYVATYKKENVGANKNTVQVLSVDKYDGDHIGLLKLDALGLKTMGMIRIALDLIGVSLEQLYEIPLDDEETLKAFERADVTGIFQFEGRSTRMVCSEMMPKTFMDLAAVNTLSRPGPLHSGQTGDFIAIRHGRKEYESLHPLLDKICAETEGQIIYQEQVLQVCGDIGLLPWTHRSKIRKVISNKEGESVFNSFWEEFWKGARSQGVEENQAREIWKRMVTAGSYSFNVAHAISYAMIGYWCMWLKVHHPLAFYAAQLRKTDEEGTQVALMRDMQDTRYGRDYKVLPPDPVTSDISWRPVKDGVMAGLMQIPTVGESKARSIIEYRETEGISGWPDIQRIKGFGPKTVEKIMAFATQDDPFGISRIKNDIADIRNLIRDGDFLPGVPMPDTNAEDIPYEAKESKHVVIGLLKNRNLQDLFENHRSRTGEVLDPDTVKDPDLKDSVTLFMEDTTGLLTVKVPRFVYPKYRDAVWNARLNKDYVIARVKKIPFLGKTVHVERLWIVTAE